MAVSKARKRRRLLFKRIRFLIILCILFFIGFQINKMLSGENILEDVLAFAQQFSKVDSLKQEEEKDEFKVISNERTIRLKMLYMTILKE